jgi:hypothetical protein
LDKNLRAPAIPNAHLDFFDPGRDPFYPRFVTPAQIGSLVESLIPLGGGTLVTLHGFRRIGKPPGADVKYDEWHRRFGGTMRIAGPLTMLTGMVILVAGFVPSRLSEAPVEELPFFPTRIGTTWIYQSNGGDITVRIAAHEQANGILCARRDSTRGGKVIYTDHVRPEQGVVVQHAVNGKIHLPGVPIVKDIKGQTRWEYTSANGKVTFRAQQSEGGPLKTPQASYERSILVSRHASDVQGEVLVQSWYVDQVGLVREFTKTPNGELLLELKSFVPPQIPNK